MREIVLQSFELIRLLRIVKLDGTVSVIATVVRVAAVSTSSEFLEVVIETETEVKAVEYSWS